MRIVLKHNVNRIKNGFAAASLELRIAAHGHSPEVARRNLEYMALLFFKPFERRGVLEEELARLPLQVEQEEGDLAVVAC